MSIEAFALAGTVCLPKRTWPVFLGGVIESSGMPG
jgi:hypothetical protein